MNFPKMGQSPQHRPPRRPARVAFFVLMLAAAAAAAGALVMALWNAVLVDALGAKPLGYWQALGLLLLCRVLFGKWGPRRMGPPGAAGGRAAWGEKWGAMSPEQRASFRTHWKARCAAPDGAKTTPPAGDTNVEEPGRGS